MQDRVKYEYAIIRIVPKVEREEFFNVGVILFSKRKKFLRVKFHICKKKLATFSCEIDFGIGSPKGGTIGELELSDRFRWLTASRSTIIQSSETHSGLCIEPEKELQYIFDSFVL